MKAIILAAGRGSRMLAATEDRPKGLVEVAGKPLLDRQITALTAAGVTEIAAVTGYRGDMIASRPLTCFANPRWAETNMVASLTAAAEWLRAAPCLVSYSDIFYSPKAPQVLARTEADIAITYDPHWLDLWQARFADPLSDAETFLLAGNGTLADIGANPLSLAEVQGQYMGLLRFTPKGWGAVEAILAGLDPARRDRLDMTSLLRLLLAAGQPIAAIAAPWPWGEVDAETDRALYEADPARYGLT